MSAMSKLVSWINRDAQLFGKPAIAYLAALSPIVIAAVLYDGRLADGPVYVWLPPLLLSVVLGLVVFWRDALLVGAELKILRREAAQERGERG